MPFKTDRQRKAFFARLNSNAPETPTMIRDKNSSYQELKRRGIIVNPKGDADKDGVINIKDCKPLDAKKQGKLHDLAISVLKKKEEFVERRREKQMAKLEDLRDKLKARRAVLTERNALQAEKQAVIDEAQKEKQAIQDLKSANKEAKRELFRTSKIGRSIKGTIRAGQATGRGIAATGRGIKATDKAVRKAAKTSSEVLKKTGKVLNKLFG